MTWTIILILNGCDVRTIYGFFSEETATRTAEKIAKSMSPSTHFAYIVVMGAAQ